MNFQAKSASAYNTRIRELPASERPRERLRDYGASSLSNAELLAIILRTGSAEQSVLNLATSLLARHGGLGGLARLSYSDLLNEKGLGAAKAAEIQAVVQLGLRLGKLDTEARPVIHAPQDVFGLLGTEMGLLDQEHLRVILLNTRNQVLAIQEVYVGSVSSALVRASEVFREAVRQNAPGIVLVHNHPSGDPQPSPDDIALTKQLMEAGKLLSIDLLDHIVIGDRRWVSMQQQGLGFPS